MLIYAPDITNRLRYTLDFIFRDVWQADYILTDRLEDFRQADAPRLNYSNDAIEGSFRIPVSGFLHQTGIRSGDPEIRRTDRNLVLFPADDKANLPFDLFSAIFYLVSRYEEYLDFEPDRHGRYRGESSFAARHDFLDAPVVDRWLQELHTALSRRHPGIDLFRGRFKFQPTHDIDIPFAYLHRGWFRTFGAGLKARLSSEGNLEQRKKVLRKKEGDPFDTFSEIRHFSKGRKPRIFFLTAGYGRYDKSISPGSGAFRDLVLQITRFADIGIHPSYRSSLNPSLIEKERKTLARIAGKAVDHGRQHYLRFRLPDSYRDYLAAGIRHDYSMGYPGLPGFRSSTSRPHQFYDLRAEEATALRIYPFQVMDRTLKDYMGLTPARAMETIERLMRNVAGVGGLFISIWHNDSLSDQGEWQGWKQVYLHLLETAKKLEKSK